MGQGLGGFPAQGVVGSPTQGMVAFVPHTFP